MELAPGDLVAVPLGARDGDRRGLGATTSRCGPACTTASRTSRTSSTSRRSSRSCASSSTGCRTTRWRRAAWCCAWRCAWASISARRARRSACGSPARRRKRMTAARSRVLAAAGRRPGARQERGGARGRRVGRRDRRADRRGHAGNPGAAAGAGGAAARSRSSRVPDFTDAQRAAADALRASVREGRLLGVTLIDGVTGSGKTEVYFEAVAETMRRGPAGADPDAGDRADRAVPRPLRRSASACGRRNGIRSLRRASARAPGRRWRRARCRSWSARARRCSCPMPISA